MAEPLEIRTITTQPMYFEENAYLVWLPESRSALVIDPGLEPELILDALRQHDLNLVGILNTHGHADHIGGNAALKQTFPAAPLLIGVGDEIMLSSARANLSAHLGFNIVSPPADRTLREGDVVELAGLRLEVLDIPGHSPGHIVYLWRGPSMVVFGGDVLFRGSIGRSDFPGGDGDLLIRGIRDKLFPLPDDTVVYPGHGPVTTIGREKRANPFAGLS